MPSRDLTPDGDPNGKPPIRVFVVDDNPIFSEVLTEVLEQSGEFTVVGLASTGETALRDLEVLPVDLVILDLILPGIGGLEVLEVLQQKRCRAKIVIFSGLVDPAAMMDGLAHGASAFVEKSWALQETVSTLRDVSTGKIRDLGQQVTSKSNRTRNSRRLSANPLKDVPPLGSLEPQQNRTPRRRISQTTTDSASINSATAPQTRACALRATSILG